MIILSPHEKTTSNCPTRYYLRDDDLINELRRYGARTATCRHGRLAVIHCPTCDTTRE